MERRILCLALGQVMPGELKEVDDGPGFFFFALPRRL
jgi:hypothetical protein